MLCQKVTFLMLWMASQVLDPISSRLFVDAGNTPTKQPKKIDFQEFGTLETIQESPKPKRTNTKHMSAGNYKNQQTAREMKSKSMLNNPGSINQDAMDILLDGDKWVDVADELESIYRDPCSDMQVESPFKNEHPQIKPANPPVSLDPESKNEDSSAKKKKKKKKKSATRHLTPEMDSESESGSQKLDTANNPLPLTLISFGFKDDKRMASEQLIDEPLEEPPVVQMNVASVVEHESIKADKDLSTDRDPEPINDSHANVPLKNKSRRKRKDRLQSKESTLQSSSIEKSPEETLSTGDVMSAAESLLQGIVDKVDVKGKEIAESEPSAVGINNDISASPKGLSTPFEDVALSDAQTNDLIKQVNQEQVDAKSTLDHAENPSHLTTSALDSSVALQMDKLANELPKQSSIQADDSFIRPSEPSQTTQLRQTASMNDLNVEPESIALEKIQSQGDLRDDKNVPRQDLSFSQHDSDVTSRGSFAAKVVGDSATLNGVHKKPSRSPNRHTHRHPSLSLAVDSMPYLPSSPICPPYLDQPIHAEPLALFYYGWSVLKSRGLFHLKSAIGCSRLNVLVYKAYSDDFKKEMAIKDLTDAYGEQSLYVRNIMNVLGKEPEFLHYHILQDLHKQRYYSVSDLMPQTLLHLVNSRMLSAPQAKCLFSDLVSSVAKMHAKRVAHCDLVPENVYVDEGGHLKLGDFESAVVAEQPVNGHYGTTLALASVKDNYSFMAPEVIQGRMLYYERIQDSTSIQYDPFKADVYALGLLYYFMRVRALPWHMASREHDVTFKLFSERPGAFRNSLKKHAFSNFEITFLFKLLSKYPNKRPTISKVMDDLFFKNEIEPMCAQNRLTV